MSDVLPQRSRRPPGQEDRAPARLPAGRPRVSVRHRRETRRAAGCHGAVRRGRPRAASRRARPLALERRARERAPARRGRSRGVVAHDATVVRRDRPLGEANGCFRELEVARTASMAAGSMGAALPEPSCGIDPTSPGLDEQLPITRPVKTGPRPRKRSASGTSASRRERGAQRRASRGESHTREARLARVPTQVQRPSPRARAVLKRARLCGRCPALSTEKTWAASAPACAFDVSVVHCDFPNDIDDEAGLDTYTAGGATGGHMARCGRDARFRVSPWTRLRALAVFALCGVPFAGVHAVRPIARSRRCCARRFREASRSRTKRAGWTTRASPLSTRGARFRARRGTSRSSFVGPRVDAHDPRTEGTRVEPLVSETGRCRRRRRRRRVAGARRQPYDDAASRRLFLKLAPLLLGEKRTLTVGAVGGSVTLGTCVGRTWRIPRCSPRV